jgi:hypothetical protein
VLKPGSPNLQDHRSGRLTTHANLQAPLGAAQPERRTEDREIRPELRGRIEFDAVAALPIVRLPVINAAVSVAATPS